MSPNRLAVGAPPRPRWAAYRPPNWWRGYTPPITPPSRLNPLLGSQYWPLNILSRSVLETEISGAGTGRLYFIPELNVDLVH